VLDRPEVTSPELAPGATFRLAIADAGTRAYHCGLHVVMRGTLIVR
jgi:plastocyanin